MPEVNKRLRDDLEESSLSSTRNTRLRQESPHSAHHETSRENSMNRDVALVPRINIQYETGGESQSEVASIASLMISEESVPNNERQLHLENSGSVKNDEDSASQPTISYLLQLTFGNVALPADGIVRTISANDDQSFRQIEQVAENLVQSTCAKGLGSRELIFRHGRSTMVNGKSFVHSLTSSEDWKKIRNILSNCWTLGANQRLLLHITRDYYALTTTATGNESFARTKNSEIHNLMKNANGRDYIPRTDLEKVTSSETIRRIIMEDLSIKSMGLEEKEVFIQTVEGKARTLLALCVYARVEMQCLKKLLDRPLSDESLPLSNRNCCHPDCGAAFRELLTKQGSFMAPMFNGLGEHKELSSSVVLPIHFVPMDGENTPAGNREKGQSSPTEDEEHEVLRQKSLARCGSGSYGRVYRVRIDPDHHRLSQNKDTLFALKEFKDQLKADSKFDQERKILDELGKLLNNHIVVHFATWTQGQNYYMLFPYAECNLREYMMQQQFGACTKENILWFLRQLHSLANALRTIHNITGAEPPPSSLNLASPYQEGRKSAWHHDIKPENILYFSAMGSKRGVLKIADFGSGKVHTLRSGSAMTRSPNGTLTYEAPEAQCERVSSRPYDIWSLGCVFLELVIWAVAGFEDVQAFAKSRRGRSFPDSPFDTIVDDAFWQMRGTGAVLRKSVIERIDRLEEKVMEQEYHAFKEVVELIRRMLNPNRFTRINALDLWNQLDSIYVQKQVDLCDIEDDQLTKPAHPDRSALPRLDLQASKHADLATSPLLMVSPADKLSPHSSRHGRHSSLTNTWSDMSLSPQSASASPIVYTDRSRRNSNVSKNSDVSNFNT